MASQTGDDILTGYRVADAAADVFCSAPADVGDSWRNFARGLSAQTQGHLASLQSYLDRHIGDLGLAYRMTGDEQERSWPLNPMPIFVGADQWQEIGEALIQRAELLETLVADIYGEQRFVADGHLPAAIVTGSSKFERRMVGLKPPGGHYLHVLAFDLARGPKGDWLVLADRVRLPVGIGYTLENRLALGRATGGLLASVGTRSQARFFDALRNGIAASCERADPRIGLLTAGRFNQSYPEQAHLARYLGFSLVEGRDLTVRDDKLYVRTIAGLKRIDAVWRWIGASNIDPLNFDAKSKIGVPNLLAAAQQGLVVANWPGAGVVESRAFPAFLPRLAKTILGEPLKLPNAATWWCGGDKERKHVLANLDRLVLSSSFRQTVPGLPGGQTRVGSSFTQDERAEIIAAMAQRPMDYTAQAIISLSTAPALIEGRFEPRGFTVRAYLARDEAGEWVVLDGGFARISQHGNLRTSLMGLGDISTDLCVVDSEAPGAPVVPTRASTVIPRRDQGLLPSQVADNLFWIGRYGERAHQTVRIVRTLLEQVIVSGTRVEARGAVTRLANLLRNLGAVPPQSVSWQPSRLAARALTDLGEAGSVRSLTRNGRQIALLLRDRLTRDSWRAITRPLPEFSLENVDAMLAACDQLVERFAALARLTYDGMPRGPAWHFLDMGLCIERGSMILQSAMAMADGQATPEELAALLDLVDGHSTYRGRYLATPAFAPVLDLVLLDPAQPRGLAYQAMSLEQHLAALPTLREDGMIEPTLRQARAFRARVEAVDADKLTLAELGELRNELARLSELIDSSYFLQEEQQTSSEPPALLA